VQFALATNGERAVLWHRCDTPTSFAWDAEIDSGADRWQASLRIPLDAIAAALGSPASAAWTFLAGFTTRPRACDRAAWRAEGHEPDGLVADPLLADPARGDFSLRPGSPALSVGFVPFVGPEPSSATGDADEEQHAG